MRCALPLIAVSTILAVTSSAAVAAPIKANKGPSRMAIKYSVDAATYSGTTYQMLPGSRLTVTIPAGQSGYLVATFQAESVCYGIPGAFCSIRILCDGTELNPRAGANFAFNSVGPTSSHQNFKSLSMIRHSNLIGAGAHACRVQMASVSSATHRVDDWNFMVVFWRRN